MRLFALIAGLAGTTQAMLNCKIDVEGAKYDLTPLGTSEHVVSHNVATPPSITNTTWYINPCAALPRDASDAKMCPEGTQICGIQRIKPENSDWLLTGVIPVAGDLDGKQNGASITLLTPENDDGKHGLRIHTKGGTWGDLGALDSLMDFVCVKEEKDESLQFVSWDLHTLKLQWNTRLACAQGESPTEPPKDDPKKDDPKNPDGDKPKDGDDVSASGGWGWFTWLFIIIVLGSAVYIIGSAWANYSRYGHIGMDSSHAEFLSEIPYLVKDFVRKVAGTFSGGSNRGGYSAV